MNFKKVLLLVAITALLTSCGCSNSARRSSKSDPVPISEVPVSSSQQPESHDNPPVSSEQHSSSNGGGQQSASHGQSSSIAPSSSGQAASSSGPTQIFLSESYAELLPGERVLVTASLDVALPEAPAYNIAINPERPYINVDIYGD